MYVGEKMTQMWETWCKADSKVALDQSDRLDQNIASLFA